MDKDLAHVLANKKPRKNHSLNCNRNRGRDCDCGAYDSARRTVETEFHRR